jgi:FdhD protein
MPAASSATLTPTSAAITCAGVRNIGPTIAMNAMGSAKSSAQLSGMRVPAVVEERPLTIFPERAGDRDRDDHRRLSRILALGFLRNQGMLRDDDVVTGVDYDEELETVVVRTARETDYEDKLQEEDPHLGLRGGHGVRRHDGGAGGLRLPASRGAHLAGSMRWRKADQPHAVALSRGRGAIHGTVLCQGDRPLVYMEDVGRHNAVDKIAGWMLA